MCISHAFEMWNKYLERLLQWRSSTFTSIFMYYKSWELAFTYKFPTQMLNGYGLMDYHKAYSNTEYFYWGIFFISYIHYTLIKVAHWASAWVLERTRRSGAALALPAGLICLFVFTVCQGKTMSGACVLKVWVVLDRSCSCAWYLMAFQHKKTEGCIYLTECLAVSEKDSWWVKMTHACAQSNRLVNRMSWWDECVGSLCMWGRVGQRQGVYTHVCLIDKE